MRPGWVFTRAIACLPGSSLVIVLDRDLVSIAPLESKRHPPAPIHRHRPIDPAGCRPAHGAARLEAHEGARARRRYRARRATSAPTRSQGRENLFAGHLRTTGESCRLRTTESRADDKTPRVIRQSYKRNVQREHSSPPSAKRADDGYYGRCSDRCVSRDDNRSSWSRGRPHVDYVPGQIAATSDPTCRGPCRRSATCQRRGTQSRRLQARSSRWPLTPTVPPCGPHRG